MKQPRRGPVLLLQVVLELILTSAALRLCVVLQFYEVDLPEASKKKQQMVKAVLPPPEQLPRPTYVGANLAEVALAQALEGSGFDPVKKTFFTCEGKARAV